ncbi:MAG: zinc-binding dehydrogenase [Planctomycetota bacterium]
MKAMTIPATGEPSVLTLAELDPPTPGDHDLLIEVHAAGLNPVDTKLRSGKFRAPVTFPLVPGFDVSGRVVGIGPEVTRFRPGDAVFASPPLFKPGAHAEYVLVDERLAARKPENLSHVEAAAIPLALLTAWELLYDMADVSEGQTVLIHAAAGGVGHFAVQLAKARGCVVLGTASSDDSFALLEELGVDHAINYKTQDVAERVMAITDVRGCDAVFDLVGAEVFKASIPLVATRGCLGTIVGIPADAELNPLFLKSASLHAEFMGSIAMNGGTPAHQGDILKQAKAMVEAGTLKPHVSNTFPLEELAAAHELQASGTATGKLVIQVKN